MEAKYAKQHSVRYYECDTQARMTLQRLIQIAIDFSGEQVTKMNKSIGRDIMGEEQLAWIIIQYEFEITRLPRAEETITIETEVGEYTKLFAKRFFTIYDENENVLLTIETLFSTFNVEKRKLGRIPSELFKNIDGLEQVKRIKRQPAPERVAEVVGAKDYYVRYFDIDSNQHVNNSHYIEWSLDVLGSKFLQHHDITYANIKFEKEVHYGDTVLSEYSLIEEDEVIKTAHRITNGEVVNSELNYHFVKREN